MLIGRGRGLGSVGLGPTVPTDGMIQRLGFLMSAWAQRWVPDPFVLALLLTLVTLALAVSRPEFALSDAVAAWGGRDAKGDITPAQGLWKLLVFAMQMCLVLVTGYALAATKAVGGLLNRLARAPGNAAQAAALTALVAMVASLINWGLGLIAGALLAREIGLSARARGVKIHYPLVAAAGFVGLLIWHGGLSGSAPLKMTQIKDVEEVLGAERAARVGTVGLDQTIFSPLNLTVEALVLVVVPVLFWMMAPRREEEMSGVEAANLAETRPAEQPARTSVSWLEQTPVLTLFICAMGFAYLWLYLSQISLWKIDINAINLFFLFLGLLLHGSPINYVRAVADGVRACDGIILQFPFYAGVQAMLDGSGIVDSMSQWIATHASTHTFPLLTFFSASVVNLFVPSGGGQWAVQGPVLVDSALSLNAPVGTAIMSLAYGDQCTNMLQVFWALPLLSITGLKARDILGYTALVMFLSLPLFLVPLLLFSRA